MSTVYRHTHRQTVPSNLWLVKHNLGTDVPVVDVYIEVGGKKEKILPMKVIAVDHNNSEIHWSSPRVGAAAFR